MESRSPDTCIGEEDEKSPSTSKPKIDSDFNSSNEFSEAAKEPKKITFFFPVLKTKMISNDNQTEPGSSGNFTSAHTIIGEPSSSGNVEKSQVNILHLSPPKPAVSKKSTPQPLSKELINRFFSNPLKTSLGEELRKNIEANNQLLAKRLKQAEFPLPVKSSVMKSSESFDDQESEKQLKVDPAPDLKIVKSKKTLLDTNDDKRIDKNNIQERLKNAIRHSTKIFSNAAQSLKAADLSLSSQSSMEILPSTVTIKEEITDEVENVDSFDISNKEPYINTSELLIQTQNDKSLKNRRGKKRHFKGATYSLYLTPHRKKKKMRQKQGLDSSCKDDETSLPSTENGSNIDSSDGCSMLSDDFNTSSEKSLADDEACYSPLPVVSDQQVDVINTNSKSASENNNDNNPLTFESETRGANIIVLTHGLPNNESSTKEIITNLEIDIKEENAYGQNSDVHITEDGNPITEPAVLSGILSDCDDIVKNRLLPKISKSRKSASSCPLISDPALISKLKIPAQAAVSCKTVEPIKENVLDGFSSYSGTTDEEGHPCINNDIIENFNIVLNTEARSGPLPKTESIFCPKRKPVSICECHGPNYEVKVGDSPPTFYCQAVDSYGDKLVGCSALVMTFRLVRPSVRIPFTVMCDMHLWRLKQHHCCPRCGLFCSQGKFLMCTERENSENSELHLYHEHCKMGSVCFCLHCESYTKSKPIQLDCEMVSPPAFFQRQHSLSLPPKARITFCVNDLSEVKDPNNEETFKIGDTVVSSEGLPDTKSTCELEHILLKIKTIDLATIPDYPPFHLFESARTGDITKVLHMLAKGVNPNEKFEQFNGSTALHAAAHGGHVLACHILLQCGAAADIMNRSLQTPLMIASEEDHEDVARCLLKGKAGICTRGDVGMTSLHLAARDGRSTICRMFLDSGEAEINAQDEGGWTPIVWASEHGQIDIVRLLLERGGNPNIRDTEGNTALHWASFCGTFHVCLLLLNYGCNVNEANDLGDTPLHIAARQDKYTCVDLLLSRSADLNITNLAHEKPLDCCKNQFCNAAKAIQLSASIRTDFEKFCSATERILSKDITNGRERYPIRCVNGSDDHDLELKEFLYVTENCETCPIKIDRCITSLQHCNCSGDCTMPNCTCAAISFKCWYDPDGHLVPEFNMLDPPLLFECNRACSCDIGICRNRVVQRGMTCRLELVRTPGKGWGVRALKEIPKGTFICEYVGEIITDSEADTRQDDSYLFDLDNKDGETYCLDARHFGNISRFINHLCEPNVIPVKVFIDHQDLSFPRIAFFSLRDIAQYEELGFDYGDKFWVIKSKSFICGCGSKKCRYSKETIGKTLENYYSRIRDDGNP